jgi:hypothetical protein
MRIRTAMFAAALGAVAIIRGWGQEAPGPVPDFIVHEWGTFTSMQGSDGITLEGVHHEEEALPPFVETFAKASGDVVRDMMMKKGVRDGIVHVTEKMETPVTYFYSERPLKVRAKVVFNQGLLTQWYPPAELRGAGGGRVPPGLVDMSRIARSSLEWGVDVLAPREGLASVPKVADGDPWQFARLPESNAVRARGTETEKFLFYRGLGLFRLPLKAKTEPGSRLTLTNEGRDALRHLIVLQVRNGRGEYTYLPELPAQDSITVQRPVSQDAPSVKDMVKGLKETLERCLVSEGLYPKEAEAMALTWEKSYFHAEGLRVLYVVPERVTTELLPLEITPRPREMKRVLVGRLECLTPEGEAEVVAALKGLKAADPAAQEAAWARLSKLGRFLEPNVRRILTASADPEIQKSAREVLRPFEPRIAAR